MKTIVIIGGSKGIGRAIINDLISENNIINISRSNPGISHQNLKHFSCDVLTDELPELQNLKVDSLIYCPGSINLKPFERMKIQDFKNDLDINFIGAVKVIQKYIANLKQSNNASILLFSTVASKIGMAYHTSIASAKASVEGLVKSLAAEYAPKIRINAIAPTITDTTLAAKLLRNDRQKEQMINRHPLKKYLSPEEIASMTTFLISVKTSAITGQIINMDCGLTSIKAS